MGELSANASAGCEAGREAAALPCLNSNNSNENASNRLSTQARKSAAALAWNVKYMCEKHGLERVGFLTLTFADHILVMAEASKRFNCLATGVLKKRYSDWIKVGERMVSGRIHFHLLVALPHDIRTGFDFDAVMQGDYRSAAKYLRSEWSFWRATAKAYRFGRTELMPIKSSEEAIGRYIGKYIAKHLAQREEADKGARLVSYSKGAKMAGTRFSWASPGAQAWRRKVKAFAWLQFQMHGVPPTMRGLAMALGPRWAYKWREFILSLPD